MEESYKSEIYSFIGALVVFILGAFLNEIKHRQRKAESDREANKKEAQQAKIESDKILKLIVYEFKKNYTLLNTISDFLDPKTKNQVIIPTFKLQIMFHEQISENNKLIIEEGELVNEINDVYYEIRHIQNRLDRVEELYKQSKSYMGSPNVPKNTMQHEIQGLKLLSDNNIERLKNLHNKLANQLGMEIISNSQQSTRQTKYNSDDTIQSGSLDPSEPD